MKMTFAELKVGDRFFFSNSCPGEQLRKVSSVRYETVTPIPYNRCNGTVSWHLRDGRVASTSVNVIKVD